MALGFRVRGLGLRFKHPIMPTIKAVPDICLGKHLIFKAGGV